MRGSLTIFPFSSITNREFDRASFIDPFDDDFTEISISQTTPMLDSIIHELISDEDESTLPDTIDMILLEDLTDEISDDF